MSTLVWKVGDRVTLKDGDGSVAVVEAIEPAIRYSYLDDPEEVGYYAHPDDLIAAPEEPEEEQPTLEKINLTINERLLATLLFSFLQWSRKESVSLPQDYAEANRLVAKYLISQRVPVL